MLDLVFSEKKCECWPVVASLFDVEPEALMVQGEVFTCLSVFVVVVIVIAVWALSLSCTHSLGILILA